MRLKALATKITNRIRSGSASSSSEQSPPAESSSKKPSESLQSTLEPLNMDNVQVNSSPLVSFHFTSFNIITNSFLNSFDRLVSEYDLSFVKKETLKQLHGYGKTTQSHKILPKYHFINKLQHYQEVQLIKFNLNLKWLPLITCLIIYSVQNTPTSRSSVGSSNQLSFEHCKVIMDQSSLMDKLQVEKHSQ